MVQRHSMLFDDNAWGSQPDKRPHMRVLARRMCVEDHRQCWLSLSSINCSIRFTEEDYYRPWRSSLSVSSTASKPLSLPKQVSEWVSGAPCDIIINHYYWKRASNALRQVKIRRKATKRTAVRKFCASEWRRGQSISQSVDRTDEVRRRTTDSSQVIEYH